jgi:hypothetical protein
MHEIRTREELHDLAPKQLVPHGYARLEDLMAARRAPAISADAGMHVLVAPSWGAHTILPTCGPELIGILLDAGFRVTLRPHFQTRWATPEVIDRSGTRGGPVHRAPSTSCIRRHGRFHTPLDDRGLHLTRVPPRHCVAAASSLGEHVGRFRLHGLLLLPASKFSAAGGEPTSRKTRMKIDAP